MHEPSLTHQISPIFCFPFCFLLNSETFLWFFSLSLSLFPSPPYLRSIELSYNDLNKLASRYNSIYLNNESALCGRLSCGGVIELVKHVITGVVTNGIAVVR